MDPVFIEALTVRTPDDLVRVILDGCCLDLQPADFLAFEPMPPPPGLVPGRAVLARMALRPGAALMRVVPAKPYEATLWAWQQPFTFASRADAGDDADHTYMSARERAFFQARGIDLDALAGPQAGPAAGGRP